MAAKSVDRYDRDRSMLVKLGEHAINIVRRFVALDHPADRYRAEELLVELQHVISEFRRLRPPPTFVEEPLLRLVRLCSICRIEITADRETLETIGAVYHRDCYERATRR